MAWNTAYGDGGPGYAMGGGDLTDAEIEAYHKRHDGMPHIHGALHEDGKLVDACRFCGRDLRDPLHLPATQEGQPK